MEPFENRSLLEFWSPRYWFAWLVYAWMRTIVLLPFAWQIRLGKRLGRVLHLLLYPRRHVAERNLEVCFPELGEDERQALCRKHFEAIGADYDVVTSANEV